jgi:hypothetical protein
MQQRGRGLASWVTRPIPFAAAVSGLGIAAFAASLLLPVGVAAVALGVVGAVTAGAGLLTLAVLGLSRVTGLERRSERAIEQGRDQILFAGSRPPESALAGTGNTWIGGHGESPEAGVHVVRSSYRYWRRPQWSARQAWRIPGRQSFHAHTLPR